jgi:quercetin dioxygenase-like cupin family protein
MSAYTVTNLREVEDQAARHGLGPDLQARFPLEELDVEQTGLSLQRLAPDATQPFAHRHKEAEEIYVVLSGGGRASLDGEVVELRPFDALRIAPGVTRLLAAGPDGMEYLAFGPRHQGDAEMQPAEWPGEGA